MPQQHGCTHLDTSRHMLLPVFTHTHLLPSVPGFDSKTDTIAGFFYIARSITPGPIAQTGKPLPSSGQARSHWSVAFRGRIIVTASTSPTCDPIKNIKSKRFQGGCRRRPQARQRAANGGLSALRCTVEPAHASIAVLSALSCNRNVLQIHSCFVMASSPLCNPAARPGCCRGPQTGQSPGMRRCALCSCTATGSQGCSRTQSNRR